MDIINEKTVDMTFDEFCRGGKSITPGPWHFVIEDDERKIAAPPKSKDYKREILMCDAAYYPHCPNEDADWRLIAAAPELLERAEADVKVMEEVAGSINAIAPEAAAALRTVALNTRAAIAKAEGKNT
jgi:hypothetical protein